MKDNNLDKISDSEKIVIITNRKTIESLSANITTSKLAGSYYSVVDQFVNKFVNSVIDGDREITLKLKEGE